MRLRQNFISKIKESNVFSRELRNSVKYKFIVLIERKDLFILFKITNTY